MLLSTGDSSVNLSNYGYETRYCLRYWTGEFVHKPEEIHWKVVLRSLTHIKKSHGKGLLYTHGHLQIEAFSDLCKIKERVYI